jgi:hypothetical protein
MKLLKVITNKFKALLLHMFKHILIVFIHHISLYSIMMKNLIHNNMMIFSKIKMKFQ